MKNEHSLTELYYLVYLAGKFLEEDGFTFHKSFDTIDPFDPGDASKLVAIALAEHGNNKQKTALNIKSNIVNTNETNDWGLWQINDGKIAHEYLTSQHEHTNSNISIFKNKSKSELRNMLLNPFYNAIAAVAMANLYQDDVGNVFKEKNSRGINNWTTVQNKSVKYKETLEEVSTMVGKQEVQSLLIDKHLNYWNDIFQTNIKNIEFNPELLPKAKEETATWDFNFRDQINKTRNGKEKLQAGSNPLGELFQEVIRGRQEKLK